jgi:hypothetical protein
MHIEAASRQGQTVYTTVIINNPQTPSLPFRTPIIIQVPADTKLPVAGASIEGDLLLAWFNAASAADQAAYLTDTVVVAPPATQPGPPTKASKLGIKRALDQIGLWATAKSAIAADPAVQEDWDLAVEISRYDPLTQSIVAALGLTSEQVDDIIARANALV